MVFLLGRGCGCGLYSEKDIARLRWVRAQMDMGLSVRRAIAAARTLEAEGRLFLLATPEAASRSGPATAAPALRDRLMEALIHHDMRRADQLIGEMLAFHTIEDLTIGYAWEDGRITVATEHLASNYLRHSLLMWMVTGPHPKPVNLIILACAPDEWHEGSLLMLGVLLRRRGWPVAYLGQNVPFYDLTGFIADIQPPAVVLLAMREETAQALAEWPKWIPQAGGNPPVTFGGRAFVVRPELQPIVPGHYLGDTIQEGWARLETLLL